VYLVCVSNRAKLQVQRYSWGYRLWYITQPRARANLFCKFYSWWLVFREIETVKMTATAREGYGDDGKTLLVLIKWGDGGEWCWDGWRADGEWCSEKMKRWSDTEWERRGNVYVILSFPFVFVFKFGPLNFFLPHVTYLSKGLEEKEDKKMELTPTPCQVHVSLHYFK
jgi:hypothetical protein